jgi:hypothetical protein
MIRIQCPQRGIQRHVGFNAAPVMLEDPRDLALVSETKIRLTG